MDQPENPATPAPNQPEHLTTEERRAALDVARRLAELGIPIFVAPKAAGTTTGFALPNDWQNTQPDPAVVDTWKPGDALCAVMGCGLDLVDVDPRNGGNDSLAQLIDAVPTVYLHAQTPSRGFHWFVASLGVGSRDKTYAGIDVKGGLADGTGRGFAFLSPTEKPSKAPEDAGVVRPYRWSDPQHFEALAQTLAGRADTSGAALAQRVRELRSWVPKARPLPTNPTALEAWASERPPHRFDMAEKAMNEKLADVRDWDPAGSFGFRQTLMRAAMTMGGYVAAGLIDEDEARERLRKAVRGHWTEPDEDDELWITQGLADGALRPFVVYTREQELEWERSEGAWSNPQSAWMLNTEAGAPGAPGEETQAGSRATFEPVNVLGGHYPGVAEPPPPPITHWIGNEPFDPDEDSTDQGFATAVLRRMNPALRYAVDVGTWLIREAERWDERADMADWAIGELAELMPRGSTPVPKELDQRTPEHWQQVRWRDFHSSAPTGRISKKMRAMVRSIAHPSSLKVADLDRDPYLLWAGNRAWDLRASGEVPVQAYVDPNTPHLHTAGCIPALVPTPTWDGFLAAVFPDPEVRSWALRVLSITLAGEANAALPILYGRERSGKTSVVELIMSVLGTYGTAANSELLSGGASKLHDAIYQLRGARLAFIDEKPHKGDLAAERLKQLTGGGKLTGRPLYGQPVVFEPTHTLVLTSNEPPPISDPALRARVRMLPCESPESLVQPWREALAVPATWAAEAPGILAMLMRECAAWLADRSSARNDTAPLVLRTEADEMAASQDPVREWRENCTLPTDPGTPGRELYKAYAEWHDNQTTLKRVPLPTETRFGRSLTDQGFPSIKRDGKWMRALSILGGGGYGPPTLTPPGGSARRVSPDGGSAAGLEMEPANAQNPSSTPLSSSSSGGLAGSSNKKEENSSSGVVENIEGLRDIPATRQVDQDTSAQTASDLQEAGSAASLAAPANPTHPAQTEAKTPTKTQETPSELGFCLVDLPEGLPEGFDPLGPITLPQKRAWAEAAGCTVPEASEALKAIKKQVKAQEKREALSAKVAELSGEEHALPVAVNRQLDILPISADEICVLLQACWERSAGELTVDMENTGYPVGHRNYALRTVQLGDDLLTLVLDRDEPYQREAIRWAVLAAPVLVAHSGQADLVALAQDDLGDFEAMMAKLKDTAVLARLNDPKICGSDGGLKEISPRVLGPHALSKGAEDARKALFSAGGWLEQTEPDTPIERSGWAQTSKTGATMIRYAGADVLDTAAISKTLPVIPDWLRDRERAFQRMTARITHHGAPLDYEHIRALEAEHEPKRAALGREIKSFFGTAIENPGSPKQLAAAFAGLGAQLPATKPDRFGKGGGSPSTANYVLTLMAREHPEHPTGVLARLVLDWRHHNTALSTFIGPYKALCELGDGRARPTIYTVGADTGRTSCVRPNAQQLPRQGGFRAMYGADPGFVIVRADFSGVEIRGAAALSGDQTLLESIRVSDELGPKAKADIHWLTAKQAFGPDATKEQRYVVKPGVFTHMYGGRAPTIAEQLGITVPEAELIARSLEALTPTYQTWSKDLIAAAKGGQRAFESYSGRIIWIPEGQERKGPNYAVQGTCREVLVDAVVNRWAQTRWGGCMILPVHDEVLAWVPAEDAHEATVALVECMTTTLTGRATVSIKAEPDDPDEATGRWLGSTRWLDAS